MAPNDERSQYLYGGDYECSEGSLGAALRDLCDRVSPPDSENGQPLLSAQDVARYIQTRDRKSRVARHLGDEALTPLLKRMVEESARPLVAMESHFAVDGACVGWDRAARRPWGMQYHLACGANTGVVGAVETAGPAANGCSLLPKLLQTVSENFPSATEVSADREYLSRGNFEVAAALGVDLYIPFKKNSLPNRCRYQSPAWDEALRLYRDDHEEFLRRYRPHVVVESVLATIKAEVLVCTGAGSDTAQLNKVLIEAVARNVRIVAELTGETDGELDPGP